MAELALLLQQIQNADDQPTEQSIPQLLNQLDSAAKVNSSPHIVELERAAD